MTVYRLPITEYRLPNLTFTKAYGKIRHGYALVAQLDRVLPSEGKGSRFEFWQGHTNLEKAHRFGELFLCLYGVDKRVVLC